MNDREKEALKEVESLLEKVSGKDTVIAISSFCGEDDEENYRVKSAIVQNGNSLDIVKYAVVCATTVEHMINEGCKGFKQALAIGIIKVLCEKLNYKIEIKNLEQ